MRIDPLYDIGGLTFSRADGGETFRIELPVFRVMPGDSIALVGPSGSGKTTVLDVLALLAMPDTAERFLYRAEPQAEPLNPGALRVAPAGYVDAMADARGRTVGYVPQRGGLLPFLDARRNILAGPEHLSKPVDTARMEALCTRLGILGVLDRTPTALSVGEQQRVAICRALLKKPRVIVADEPTAALDPANAGEVMRLFVEMAEEDGTALLIATHDRERAVEAGFSLCECRLGRGGPGERVAIFSHDSREGRASGKCASTMSQVGVT